ncbi:DUF2147 domain-containing protein [Reinekea sp.]|jgi:uncharacterized protein (DUF2147 family)|uniref:DUF2147 domain-containing protein n=1 Tax=Reinekea sp. TaxID=1970455 RepID=UPI002A831BF2|nr:DUF2147 domain-containing protein [Reinekea sp.]
MKTFFSIFLCLALSGLNQAATLSPVGQWQTIDDETGAAKSRVTLWLKNGELLGRIDTLLKPEEPNPICDECKGTRKNQPIEGMTFVWGLTENGKQWDGGIILDPGNGKEYKARLRLTDQGERLEVRGYIGFALLGRTQIWQRLP